MTWRGDPVANVGRLQIARAMKRAAKRHAALAHFKALSENLAADNARLRGLIKDAEFPAAGDGNHVCPYCNAYFYETRPGALHAVDCPAFTPDGVVK